LTQFGNNRVYVLAVSNDMASTTTIKSSVRYEKKQVLLYE
jgi:hypothetical protein